MEPIAARENITREQMMEAQSELNKIADYVRWQVCPTIYAENKWLGVAWRHDWPRPSKDLERYLDHDDDELVTQTIGLAEMYLDMMRAMPADSSIRLLYTFQAAITMAHEVAHVVYQQDERVPYGSQEPYVEDDCWAELGSAFISRLFDGCWPAFVGDEKDRFTWHLCDMVFLYWDKQLKIPNGPRPLYRTLYGIPISYVEEKLSQAFWDKFNLSTDIQAYAQPLMELSPFKRQAAAQHATAMTPEWEYHGTHQGRLTWKGHFRLDKYANGARVREDIPQEELLEARFDFDELRSRPKHWGRSFIGVFDRWSGTLFGGANEARFEDIPGAPPSQSQESFGAPTRRLESDTTADRVSGGAFGRYNDLGDHDKKDGLLPKDVEPSLEEDNVEPALIRVSYRLEDQDVKKPDTLHPRPGSDGDFAADMRKPKRAKLSSKSHTTSDSRDSGSNGTTSNKKQWNVIEEIEKLDVRKEKARRGAEVLQYLVSRQSFSPLLREYLERKEYLEFDHLYDRPVLASFLENKLEDLAPLFVDDRASQKELLKASVNNVRNWSFEDRCDFCICRGITLPSKLDRKQASNDLDPKVMRYKEAEFRFSEWTDDELRLGILGGQGEECSRTALITIAEFGTSGYHKRINIHWNFGALLGQSSVSALKQAIRNAGGLITIEEGTTLILTFGMGGGAELEDDVPLIKYAGEDFREVLIELAQPESEQGGAADESSEEEDSRTSKSPPPTRKHATAITKGSRAQKNTASGNVGASAKREARTGDKRSASGSRKRAAQSPDSPEPMRTGTIDRLSQIAKQMELVDLTGDDDVRPKVIIDLTEEEEESEEEVGCEGLAARESNMDAISKHYGHD